MNHRIEKALNLPWYFRWPIGLIITGTLVALLPILLLCLFNWKFVSEAIIELCLDLIETFTEILKTLTIRNRWFFPSK